MSQKSRAAASLAAVILIVAGFVVLRPKHEKSSPTGTAAPAGAAHAASPADASARTVIRVRGGKPVSDIVPITVKKGGVIRFSVTSDETQEIHFHGYDIAKDAAPGKPAQFIVPATIGGVFEVELEKPGIQIAKVTVAG